MLLWLPAPRNSSTTKSSGKHNRQGCEQRAESQFDDVSLIDLISPCRLHWEILPEMATPSFLLSTRRPLPLPKRVKEKHLLHPVVFLGVNSSTLTLTFQLAPCDTRPLC